MRADRETYVRNETDAQRLDRNYSEQLQELRVAQAGVQIMFAFLLSIAFQQRFTELTRFQKDVYLATLMSSALSIALFIAPVPAHRVMFRKRLKDELVVITGRLAIGGLTFLALALLGALFLVVDVVGGRGLAIGAVIIGTVVIVGVWWILPARIKRPAMLAVPDPTDHSPSAADARLP